MDDEKYFVVMTKWNHGPCNLTTSSLGVTGNKGILYALSYSSNILQKRGIVSGENQPPEEGRISGVTSTCVHQ
jgi:hypothetical protein